MGVPGRHDEDHAIVVEFARLVVGSVENVSVGKCHAIAEKRESGLVFASENEGARDIDWFVLAHCIAFPGDDVFDVALEIPTLKVQARPVHADSRVPLRGAFRPQVGIPHRKGVGFPEQRGQRWAAEGASPADAGIESRLIPEAKIGTRRVYRRIVIIAIDGASQGQR